MAEKMTREEIRAFLVTGTRTGKLATVDASGQPHVVPIWFVLDGDDVVFTTGEDTVKGRNLQRDPRVAMVVDDERPPFAYVQVRGRATIGDGDLLHWATRIAARYMGEERAEEFGRRNAV
ncbi:MAG: PPOX class F420-dependent oxidoreductase, partial [Actinomycetota bacterium]